MEFQSSNSDVSRARSAVDRQASAFRSKFVFAPPIARLSVVEDYMVQSAVAPSDSSFFGVYGITSANQSALARVFSAFDSRLPEVSSALVGVRDLMIAYPSFAGSILGFFRAAAVSGGVSSAMSKTRVLCSFLTFGGLRCGDLSSRLRFHSAADGAYIVAPVSIDIANGAVPIREISESLVTPFMRQVAEAVSAAYRSFWDARFPDLGDAFGLADIDQELLSASECSEVADSLAASYFPAVADLISLFGGDGEAFLRRALVRPLTASQSVSKPSFWARLISSQCARRRSDFLRASGFVCKPRSQYVAKSEVMAYRRDRAKMAHFLKNSWVTNGSDVVSLFDIASSTESNPKNRNARMMTQINGTAKYLQEQGREPVFLTMTTPSRFHAYGKDGRLNPRYDMSTARDAQQWLCKTWRACVRALCSLGYEYPGIRVVEPHHDGTPHWHFVIWMRPEQIDHALEVMRSICLRDSGSESGAAKHRFVVVRVDPSKGDAIGYIAKYLEKGLDGLGMPSEDFDLEAAITLAERIACWKRLHGFRQFQFFGNASVSCWRELRRVSDSEVQALEDAASRGDVSPRALRLFRSVCEAAAGGDWHQYLKLQGGVGVAPDRRPVRILTANGRFSGFSVFGRPLSIVREKWVSCAAPEGLGLGLGGREADAPWTRLNNCPSTRREFFGDSDSSVGVVFTPYEAPVLDSSKAWPLYTYVSDGELLSFRA